MKGGIDEIKEAKWPDTLKLEIVTPEAKTFSDDVEMVTLTGIGGEMGILPQHMPLMTQLVAGEIIARKDGENIFLAVGDGFVQVTGERVVDSHGHGHSRPKTLTKPMPRTAHAEKPRRDWRIN